MFKLKAPFSPTGDQPKAIEKLIEGLNNHNKIQTLLGVTGSGKTFTVSHVIAKYNKPTLVMAHNKTLAFQLYKELKEFFPENNVEFFISYYDYYQPESYLPASDTYIEKDAKINSKIDQMRLKATVNLVSKPDTIIVASVSAIYGLSDPTTYKEMTKLISTNQIISRRDIMTLLLHMQYERNDTELVSGKFRVKGSIIDIIPPYQDNILRIQLKGNMIHSINELDDKNFNTIQTHTSIPIFPAKHFVVDEKTTEQALLNIKKELKEQLPILEEQNKVFAYRLKQKVNYDIEMIKEMGYCNGIENYSRFFDNRKKGQKPYCLLDFFPKDFLLIIDESHQTIPQIGGMYKGDKSRKETLVEYGFRLPSALDNRPLMFNEFETYMQNVICVSATPGPYEYEHSAQIVEQIIRPTGLVDPVIEIKPSLGQMQDLIQEIQLQNKKKQRTLVTTITKRLAEDLTEYFANHGLKVRYLHSEIDALERTEIIRELRLGKFDVLVGINLLREGLDIPEVGLVAILDADKEGFLRNDKSLIQTIGRAARNADARVILYADRETDAMKKTIQETNRRRTIQIAHNKKNNITPKTIIKAIGEQVSVVRNSKAIPKNEFPKIIANLEEQMKQAAESLDFELAIRLRDEANKLKKELEYKNKK